MRIGVDVGGTNTDAVLLDQGRVIAGLKRPTSLDVSSGIRDAIQALLEQTNIAATRIDAVMIGTTHFTNAFVQGRDLSRVAAIRIGYPAGRSIPPFTAWPSPLRKSVCGYIKMIGGGFQFDGKPIGPLDIKALREAALEIADLGITEVALISVFAQVNPEHEYMAADILRAQLPGIGITLSNEVGRTGLIERENATIMNASLRPLAHKVTSAFADALKSLGISAPFYVSQNDGTLMQADHMRRLPVLTFAAGPTNSLRGAYMLTGCRDALVADIGGTTSDIGMLVRGFPRQSSLNVDIGGIRTNFRMPDILSIGLGGGSRVHNLDGEVTIGPDSVGFNISKEALIFGGDVLTASDIAVAAKFAQLGDSENVSALSPEFVKNAVVAMHALLSDGLDRMKTTQADIPLILVGGGAMLIDWPLAGITQTIRPPDAGVANAVGAAIGQISGEVDRIFNCGETGRDTAIEDAKRQATEAAIKAGADFNTIVVTELDDLPLQYLPGGARRIICRVVGDMVPAKEIIHA
jgi:N-methylhydantoinase A/oxoprolinase/acetone carboxylase beta subunit